MEKFRRSWQLMKSSLNVIARNKELLIFPVVAFICTVGIAAFFLAPPLLRPTGYSYASAAHWKAIGDSMFQNLGASSTGRSHPQLTFTPGATAYLAFLYFVSMFVATFCNVAFYHEILAALRGEAVSIGRGLKFATTRWKSILMWTLLAGLVGLLIKTIEERMALVGQIIGKIIGLAWSVAAVFAIPVIVCEAPTANPLSLLRKSAGILKRTWGEALIGYAGLAFANSLIAFGSLIFVFGAGALSVTINNYLPLIAAVVAWVFAIIVWSYITSVASNVYRGALYLYAAEGTIPAPYDRDMLDAAWKYRD